MLGAMRIMATAFKRSHACTAILSAPDPAAGHHQSMPPLEVLDTHRQVWVSLLWGHCPWLPCPRAHKVFFVPSKSLFPQSCVSFGGSMVGLMVTASKRAYATPRVLHPEPLPLRQATADPDLCRRHSNTDCRCLCGVSGSWCAQGLFEPSERLWQVFPSQQQ